MVHILEAAFNGTFIFVGTAVHTTDWIELITARAVKVRRLFPI
jgi:hypothetical protein